MARDVHTYFGLSYSNYLVRPRTLLQSMPEEWQERFVGCLEEMDAAFEHVPQAPSYNVQPASWKYVSELTDEEREEAGVVLEWPSDEARYFDRHGNELEDISQVPLAADEPIPPYNRGRTHIEPNLDAIPDRFRD